MEKNTLSYFDPFSVLCFIGYSAEESLSAVDETNAAQREDTEDSETEPAASAEIQNAQVLAAYFSWAKNAILDEDVDQNLEVYTGKFSGYSGCIIDILE